MSGEKKSIREFFRFENNKFACLIPDCRSQIATLKDSSLMRHFASCHSSRLCEVKSTNKKYQSLQSLRQDTLMICVEHVTINARTLNSINDSAFRKLLQPRLDTLQNTEFKLTMNDINSKLRPMIHDIAEQIRAKIREEFKERYFATMFDTVTKRNRAFLGIDVRAIINGQIITRCIGMDRIRSEHTGKNIAEMIIDILSSHGISMKKFVASTVDNAKNMIKAVKVIDAMASQGSDENSSGESDNDDDTIEYHWVSPEFQQHLMEAANQEICSKFKPYLYDNVECIRCACHTIHLAVVDSLNATNCVEIINKARELVKTLRLQSMILKLEEKHLPIPLIDCVTRWFSTYTMVCDIF